MSTLAVVVSAWNEEQHLADCLASAQWADELIVVDSASTDKTPEIAKTFTKHVYTQPNQMMLNLNKNFGFSRATADWILSLDADEELTPELAHEIRMCMESDTANGYWLPRKNIIFGQWIKHGLWWPDKQLRLFRRGKGKFPCKHIHEYIAVDGTVAEIKEPFVHYNYRYISQFIRKMDQIYTESEVTQYLEKHKQLHWHDAIRMPVGDFVKIYFMLEGYKDGLHGLVLSILQAFYAFVIFAKAWEKRGFPSQDIPLNSVNAALSTSLSEIKYWQLTAAIKHSRSVFSRLWLKVQRKYVTQTE